MKKAITFTMIALGAVANFTSCSNEDLLSQSENETETRASLPAYTEEQAMEKFAEILSQATYNNKAVREFLKSEAIKQFDKNYDVLYAKVKDYQVGDNTFEQILEKYSSKKELEDIFKAVPTLNIYIPSLPMFDIKPENLDCNDKEVPVVLPGEKSNSLLLNGNVVDSVKIGYLPDFQSFVVNSNSRVRVNTTTRASGATYSFIDEAFNGEVPTTRTETVNLSMVGTKAIQAYNYFNRDDNSNYSKALQRDYIYYGMTPTSTRGTLNRSVSEYLTFIKVDPKAYFQMDDVHNDPDEKRYTDDPYIQRDIAWIKGRDFTTEELVNQFWTEGAYKIRMEIVYSSSASPIIKYISVRPEDIWDFNFKREYRHRTGFRHSKYSYWIDPNKFTSKRYDVTNSDISFEKWSLSTEGLTRIVHFYEVDKGTQKSVKYTYEVDHMKGGKVSGNVKLGLGLGEKESNKIEIGIGGEASSSTTEKKSTEVTLSWTDKDDDLGSAVIYFYDPIIESKGRNNTYNVKTYNTGCITFGVTAR